MFATIDRSCKRKKTKKEKEKEKKRKKKLHRWFIDDPSVSTLYPRKRSETTLFVIDLFTRSETNVQLDSTNSALVSVPTAVPFSSRRSLKLQRNFTRCEFPVPKLARIRVGGLTRQSEHCSQTETSRISLIRVSSVAAYRLSDAIVFHARIEGEEGVY